MKHDLILAGVGGQGVVSLGAVVAAAARKDGFAVQLSEVHGMAQRGGSVRATLRIADRPIHGPLIPAGTADGIVATEPLEALRHLPLLAPGGLLLTAIEPHRNIPDYPEQEELLARIRAQPRAVLVDARRLAREAGAVQAANLVMVGVLSNYLPLTTEALEEHIRERFAAKGSRVVEVNLRAFRAGRECPCRLAS